MRNRTDKSDKQDLSYLNVDIVNYIVTDIVTVLKKNKEKQNL